ncbi:MAG: tetratricopeptide repeat-containing protein [Candidatus Aminicenantes bacterium]|nr:tetratricopeptide repeat-containing protein [Candidatus Aminicenantes bacterium]MBL7084190.1 tetratricopeptide repeat-containing protein [Candidatus Aminicenantes bacterium]
MLLFHVINFNFNNLLRWGDKYSLVFYRLGKIYQAQGNKEKAVEFYKKFLGI